MSLCRTLRAFTNLAVDAVEAVVYWLDFSDIADEIWSKSASSASASQAADGEPSGDSVPTQDVESPLGLQSVDITPADLEFAAWASRQLADVHPYTVSGSDLLGLSRRLDRAGIQLKQAIK